MSDSIRLLVGLANPGAEYAQTRHNAGAWVIEELARQHRVILKHEPKFFGLTGRITLNGEDVRLLIPTTYMNLSGRAVGAMCKFYQIPAENVMVAHDELDMPPGHAKFKKGGGHGGHNGLRDIIAQLGNNKEFYRLRIGIGHPGNKNLVANYVLHKPSLAEQALLESTVDEATRCIELLFKEGLSKAQNRLHSFKAA